MYFELKYIGKMSFIPKIENHIIKTSNTNISLYFQLDNIILLIF